MTLAETQKPSIPIQKLWSVDDYYRMSEVGILAPDERTELIEGEIILMAAKNPPHVAIGKFAADHLSNLLGNSVLVRTQDPVRLSSRSEPEPDIALVQPPLERYFDRHPTPNEIFLVIEVADATLNYDLKRKAEMYAKAKISDYWVIDVKLCLVHVFREPMQNTYQQKSILAPSDSVAIVAFPDLIVSIRELFPQHFLDNL